MKIDWQKIYSAKWYRQRTDSIPYFILEPIYGIMELLHAGERCIFHLGKNSNELFYDEKFMDNLARQTLHQQQKNPDYTKSLRKKWQKIAVLLKNQINKVTCIDFKKLSDRDLESLHYKFSKTLYKIWGQPFFLDIFDTDSEMFIGQELQPYKNRPTPDEISTLTLPSTPLETQKFRLALLQLKQSPTFENFHKLISRFYFIRYGYMGGQRLTIQSLNKEIREIRDTTSSITKLLWYQKDLRQRKNRIIKKYRLEKQTQRLFEFFSEVTEWRDERKTMLQKSVFALELLGKEWAKRSGVPWTQLSLCRPCELTRLSLTKKVVKKYENIIGPKVLICCFVDRKLVYIKDKNYRRIIKVLYPSRKSLTELRGQSASFGCAQGRVKIIHGEKGFHKFKKGEILITAMTRPEFMPVIKKAKAIVTDEGGVTSHAAIVSRELGIPCIIGTKVATKVFKDGDVIEVDAYKGIVKKISS